MMHQSQLSAQYHYKSVDLNCTQQHIWLSVKYLSIIISILSGVVPIMQLSKYGK